MQYGNKIWNTILDKIYESQKEVLEKIESSTSLEPPYSAPVSTILHCYTRAIFDKKFGMKRTIPTNVNIFMGLLFDFTIKVVLQGYPTPEHYYIKDFSDEEGNVYRIHAGPDIIMDNEVIELKYTSALIENIPMEHHEAQLKIYMNITGMSGRLVYLTPQGVREYYYEASEAFSDQEVAKLAREFFIERKSPRYEWECKYCQYKSVCALARIQQSQEK